LKVNFGDTLPPLNRMRKMQLCSLWVSGERHVYVLVPYPLFFLFKLRYIYYFKVQE
jgi:hypothetical protein